MRRLAATLLFTVGCAAGVVAAQDFPGIEKLMSAEEFEAAGLGKLSDSEREALDAWLLRYTADEAETLRKTRATVKEKAEEAARIETRVRAPFEGWNGETVFRLENGQVWRQRIDGRFFYRDDAYPGDARDVVIDKNFLGFWRLTHVASGRSVGVTRVR